MNFTENVKTFSPLLGGGGKQQYLGFNYLMMRILCVSKLL